MRSTALFVALTLLVPVIAFGQEDTTPPVLLDFTVSPVVFDAGLGDVTIEACVTAEDDLAGLWVAVSTLGGLPAQAIDFIFNESGPLLQTACADTVVAQFAPYGTYNLTLSVRDTANNIRFYRTNPAPPDVLDLCQFGPCRLVNRPESGLPDGDSDGVPDDADNCPNTPNPGQEDGDLDLIGDVCDPFPEDRDNEQAQCELDLAQCEVDLDQCLAIPPFTDTDGDGEADQTDACPDTPSSTDVDSDGCSLEQFCADIEVNSPSDAQACRRSDWRNDEPVRHPRDCRLSMGGSGWHGLRCVVR